MHKFHWNLAYYNNPNTAFYQDKVPEHPCLHSPGALYLVLVLVLNEDNMNIDLRYDVKLADMSHCPPDSARDAN